MKIKKSNIYKPYENSISDMLKGNDNRPNDFNNGKVIEVTEEEYKRIGNWAVKVTKIKEKENGNTNK